MEGNIYMEIYKQKVSRKTIFTVFYASVVLLSAMLTSNVTHGPLTSALSQELLGGSVWVSVFRSLRWVVSKNTLPSSYYDNLQSTLEMHFLLKGYLTIILFSMWNIRLLVDQFQFNFFFHFKCYEYSCHSRHL